MAAGTYVKQITTKDGKNKFQAQVWHKGEFYASKTFDLRPLAVAYKEDALRKAVSGTFPSAAARRATNIASASLNEKMTHWAALYVEKLGAKIGRSRSSEYIHSSQPMARVMYRDT